MSINLYYLPACIYLCAKFHPAQCLNTLNGFDFRSDFFFTSLHTVLSEHKNTVA